MNVEISATPIRKTNVEHFIAAIYRNENSLATNEPKRNVNEQRTTKKKNAKRN